MMIVLGNCLRKRMSMNSTISIVLFLAFLFFVSATGARSLINGQSHTLFARFPRAADGICAAMIETWGYVCEEHKVTTADGYILSMQRIPASRSGAKPDKPPVLLQHGLLMDAMTWVLNPPDQSLAFILADNGYDVWLSNTRGTKYSRGHTSLSAFDLAYWDWSWDELVAYDLPAVVQHVSDQTGQKPHYVGHSLGTLVALAAFSKNGLVTALRSAALLSPIAYVNQVPSALTKGAAHAFLAEDLYWLGVQELNPREPMVLEVVETLCTSLGLDCTNLMTPFTGPNCCLNSSITSPFLDHELQPTATKNAIHLSQMVRQGSIAKFDYGAPGLNVERYGQPTPPVYEMASIPHEFPLYVSYGGQDQLSDPGDVQTLLDSLRDHNSDQLVVQYREDYAHADFVFAVNANQIVYYPLMAFFGRN
uniref:Lipase n=1 Tax=Kalanchoe fedtschenkoi TaxID=63787 RepID=A0A7N0RIS4_KALFE